MKKFLSVILAASMLLSLTACAGNESSTSDSSTSTESADSSAAESQTTAEGTSTAESTASEPAQTEESAAEDTRTDYEKMVDRSLLSTGSMTRMANVFKRAQNGEPITAAYIGGSITEGYNAGTTEFYAKTCTDLLQSYFPGFHRHRSERRNKWHALPAR